MKQRPLEREEFVMREMQIRADFKRAFDLVANGRDLSYKLKFSLGDNDLANLAKLHRDEPEYRQKIFDLLEDCNFHSENAALEGGLYEEFINHTWMDHRDLFMDMFYARRAESPEELVEEFRRAVQERGVERE